jgi:hypothetical protein
MTTSDEIFSLLQLFYIMYMSDEGKLSDDQQFFMTLETDW